MTDKRTKGYVVKGDKVKILEIGMIRLPWIKIEYQGNKKNYIKWIKLENVEVDEDEEN